MNPLCKGLALAQFYKSTLTRAEGYWYPVWICLIGQRLVVYIRFVQEVYFKIPNLETILPDQVIAQPHTQFFQKLRYRE